VYAGGNATARSADVTRIIQEIDWFLSSGCHSLGTN
jgi:hypothetical protein